MSVFVVILKSLGNESLHITGSYRGQEWLFLKCVLCLLGICKLFYGHGLVTGALDYTSIYKESYEWTGGEEEEAG